MDMTNQEYSRYVEQKAKPSPIWKNLTWAFCTGGLICTGGQALLNLYRGCGLSEGDAGTAVSVTIIFLAALFTGLGWFDRLAKHAGAGTLVPSLPVPGCGRKNLKTSTKTPSPNPAVGSMI